MAVITISRGSYYMGKAVAEQVAEKLGYSLVSRDVLLEASERFRVPEIKLARAIHDAPGILDRLSHGRQSYVAFIRAALARRAAEDNLVYHGLAGHLLLTGVDHVLKVRITANLEQRIVQEMERSNISRKEARDILLKDDNQRVKWTKSLYGVDPSDCNLYDMVIRIDKITIDQAVDYICKTAISPAFQSTEKSLRQARDFALACQIKAALVDQWPNVKVACRYGNLIVYTKDKEAKSGKLRKHLKDICERLDLCGSLKDLHNLEVHKSSRPPADAV